MKARYKIGQLAAKPISVELKHPLEQFNTSETGGTGIFMKVVGPHSKVFNEAKDAFDNSDQTKEDNVKLFASCVVGWDKEDFDVEYSPEEAVKLFSDPENVWIVNCIAPIVRDSINFFQAS